MTGDGYEIPAGFFPSYAPLLPNSIGKVVMLAALLETKIEALASSVDNQTQDVYGGQGTVKNADTIRGRLRLYKENPAEAEFGRRTQAFLVDAESILDERNFIVHGVWPKHTETGWWAWKPRRYKKGSKVVDWIEGRDITKDDFFRICDALVELIHRAQALIADAGSIPRRKD